MKSNPSLLAALALAFAVVAGAPAPASAGAIPTLSKSFSSAAITDGGTTTLTFTLTNPAGAPAVSNVGFTDTLPAGLVVQNAPNEGGTCANAAAATTATGGSNSITVTALQVPAGSSTCTVTVDVTNATGQLNPDCTGNPASFTNGSGNVVVTNVTNGIAASCLTVVGVTPGTPTATPTNTPTTVPPTSTPTTTPSNTPTTAPPTSTPTMTPSNTPTTVPPTATATVVSGGPPLGSIPTLSAGMLALLAVAFAATALLLVRRT